MKRLNGMDAMLLYSETPNLHTHTLKVAIVHAADFDGEFTFDVFRRTIARRLHLLDPLRYQLVDIPWKLHHPMWLENCPIDLDYHLRRVRVPSPGGRRELDEVIGQIASTPLDRSRPLWEFHFAEGMADNRFALIGKVHHTLADGVASANLLARLMDLAGSAQNESDDYVTCDPPSRMQLLVEAQRDHFHNIAALPGLISDAVRGVARLRKRTKERADHPDIAKIFQAPSTFLNHVVSPVRTFATATLSLAEVKETAKHLGVTFNDVVLAMAAGGLRELLLRYDGRADRPILDDGPSQHRQDGGANHRQRNRRPHRLTACTRRRPAAARGPHVGSHQTRQGGLRPARPEAAGPSVGIPAAASWHLRCSNGSRSVPPTTG